MKHLPFLHPFWSRILLCTAGFLLGLQPAWAHKPSDSYLSVHVDGSRVTGEWHLALRDIEDALGLDANDDGAITWDELRAAESSVSAYALARLRVSDSHELGSLRITQLLVDQHSDGAYAVLRFLVENVGTPSDLTIQYQALFDIDPSHRGLLRIKDASGTRIAVFSPDSTRQRFSLNAPVQQSLAVFLKEGIWHIWTGYDHLLFLIALLLPGVLRRHGPRWEPQEQIRLIISDVLETVTAFTVAHSLTLSLAALGWVRLPPRLVESVIAGSVVLAAANNLKPFLPGRVWPVAFCFGLIHGFGFANALVDLGLGGGALVPALLGFNLGVEIGQLAVVVLVLPFVLGLRHQPFYRRRLLPFSSAAIGVLAATWLAERVFDLRWLPF